MLRAPGRDATTRVDGNGRVATLPAQEAIELIVGYAGHGIVPLPEAQALLQW